MKKKKLLLVILSAVILVALGTCIWLRVYQQDGERVFENIKPSNTKNIYVRFGGFEPYALSDEEKEEFFNFLPEIVIHQKNTNDEMYTGDFADFIIEKENGDVIKLDPSSPHLFINGECYNIKIESQSKLYDFQEFMHELVDKHGLDESSENTIWKQ